LVDSHFTLQDNKIKIENSRKKIINRLKQLEVDYAVKFENILK